MLARARIGARPGAALFPKSTALRCYSGRAAAPAFADACGPASSTRLFSRGLSSRFKNTKKAKVEVLEKEREQSSDWISQSAQQQQQQQQQSGAPSSSFPSYVPSQEREREQQGGTQFDALNTDVVAHMRKVYGTMAVGIGIAAGASMFTMATPLIGVHPMIPGLLGIAPLMGIMYTSNRTHSQAMRAGMFAAFCGLSGMSLAPMCYMAMKMSPALVPQALAITTGVCAARSGPRTQARMDGGSDPSPESLLSLPAFASPLRLAPSHLASSSAP